MSLEGTCSHCNCAPPGFSLDKLYAGGGRYLLLCSDCQLIAARLLLAHCPAVPPPRPGPGGHCFDAEGWCACGHTTKDDPKRCTIGEPA